MKTSFKKAALRSATSLTAAAVLCASSAYAQDTDTSEPAAEEAADADVIIVTGSLLRRVDTETPSPVTVLTADNMQERGLNTAAEALQRLSANGSGTITEGWNNGNNFAAGANAVSLRGLTVQNTLTIFDGMRMAVYPVADDGHRNFVDLNTIPDNIIDRIEVLKDGASSTYGADAVAGVINVITKKEIQGIHADVSSGISQEGDGSEQRLDLTAGYGDLDADGFNVYVSGMYRKSNEIRARNRDFPWNTGDYSGICNDAGACMRIPSRWYTMGVNTDGSLGGSTIPYAPIVAAFDPSLVGQPGSATNNNGQTSPFQLLNPDCAAFKSTPVTLPDSATVNSTTGFRTYAANQCSTDFKKLYGTVRPESERYGFSGRATVKVGDRAEAFAEVNYMNTHTTTQIAPTGVPANTPPPSRAVWTGVVLPAYVCSSGTATFENNFNVSSGCDASNGILNPDNPFAASGQSALVRARYDLPQTVETKARALRARAGIDGTFGDDDEWRYGLNMTASEVELDRISENYIIPQRLADMIATGQYSFSNPASNSQTVRDYIAPVNKKTSTSKLWQVEGTMSRDLFELPGGTMQGLVGLSYRKESLDDESANPENLAHPYDRYLTINAVGAVGSRNVKSAFFELNAPVIDMVEIDASGRYDKYSSGQDNFSPKFGAKFKPIEQIVLRGTWSKGFRIPSFNEAFGLPTTGYTNTSVDCDVYASFCAAHGNNTYVTSQYSLGRTSVGNEDLKPEKSTSWTLGTVIEPIRNVSFTIDYFNIKVDGLITGISADAQDAALDAYLATGATDAVQGVTVIPGTVDPQNPNALALPGFIQYSYENADSQKVQGIDFAAQVKQDFGGVQWFSSLDASYLIKYQVRRANGTVERYDGSLSPCDYTSCSGSPKWRGSWQNTFTMDKVSVTATAYYTDGYDLASVDYGGVKGDCLASIGASVVTYTDGTPVKCKIGAQWNVDLAANVEVTENISIYANVMNVLGIDPKFDPSAAYSIFNYNPAWGQANMVGRFFRLGARVDF